MCASTATAASAHAQGSHRCDNLRLHALLEDGQGQAWTLSQAKRSQRGVRSLLRFHGLTPDQKGIIHSIKKDAAVEVCGVDANCLPVIRFTDARRTTEWFAIPRTTSRRGAVAPKPPLRSLSDEELDDMDVESFALLA